MRKGRETDGAKTKGKFLSYISSSKKGSELLKQIILLVEIYGGSKNFDTIENPLLVTRGGLWLLLVAVWSALRLLAGWETV